MKQKVSLAIIFSLVITVMYYIIPSNSALHNKVFAADEKQSTIAGIVVDGMNRQEMNQILQQEITNWVAEEITITGGGKTVKVDASSLQFDIADSIDRYEMLTKKPWYAFWKRKPVVQIPASVLLTEDVSRQIAQVPQWDYEETSNNLIAQAAYLKSYEVEATVNDLAEEISQQLLAAVVEPVPKNSVGIQEIIEPFYDYTLMSHAEFSYLELLDGQESFANDEALNFVASMLYSAALQANSEIIERHSQNIIPSYLEPGMEAAIEKNGSKNLRFVNATDEAIQLEFIVQGEELKLEAYATNLVEPSTLRIAREKEIEPRTIVRYSKDLALGRQRVLEQGENGIRVIVYRSHPEKGEELISRDYYAPINKVILKSSRTPEPEPEPQYVVPSTSQNTAGDFGMSVPESYPNYSSNPNYNGGSNVISNSTTPSPSQLPVNSAVTDKSAEAPAAKNKMNKEKKISQQ